MAYENGNASSIRGTKVSKTDPANGEVLAYNSTSEEYEPSAGGGGSGDVTAAATITDNAIVRGDGGVKGVQQSGITIDDSDNVAGANVSLVAGANVVTVDDTNFKVIDTTNLQTYLEQNDTALLNARSTGVRYGGRITDQGLGVARISAGAGQILNNTDSENPTYTSESWIQTDLDLSAVDGVYYIYVNSAGVITSQTTFPARSEFRTKIFLQRVSVRGGLISGFAPIAAPIQQDTSQIGDLYGALGTLKSGQSISAASTDLTIAISSGSFFGQGIGYNSSYLQPNQIDFSLSSPATFRYVTQDGTQGADVTSVVPGSYDVSNTITAIPGSNNRATLQAVWRFSSGNIRVFYGQQFYASETEAVASVDEYNSSYIVPSTYSENGVLLGFIVVIKNATNLSTAIEASFISTNQFGGIGGGVVSSGSSVSGPASATDNGVAVFDGTTGQAIKDNTGVTIDASANMAGVNDLTTTGNIGVGLTPTANMAGLSVEAGLLTLKETTTPTADINYGKIYTKTDNALYFQDGAGTESAVSLGGGGGLTWGDSITSASNETLEGLTLTLDNTQDNAEEILVLDTGTSAQGHTGLLINAKGASASQRGIKIDMGTTGTGRAIDISGTSASAINQINHSASFPNTTTSDAYGYKFTNNSNTFGAFSMIGYNQRFASNIRSHPAGDQSAFNFFVSDNGKGNAKSASLGWARGNYNSKGIWGWQRVTDNGGRTLSDNEIGYKRETTSAHTATDNYDNFKIYRETVVNNAGASITENGSILNLENIATQTAGTLTDTVNLLELTQDVDSTGAHILFSAQTNGSVGATDGQFWFDGTDLKLRAGGTTYTLTKT